MKKYPDKIRIKNNQKAVLFDTMKNIVFQEKKSKAKKLWVLISPYENSAIFNHVRQV